MKLHKPRSLSLARLDLQSLREDSLVPSFMIRYVAIESVECLRQFPKRFEARFPNMARLLRAARITRLKTVAGLRVLFAWTRKDGKPCGWLCYECPTDAQTTELHSDHRLLLTVLGGVLESWNSSDQGEVLLGHFFGIFGVADWCYGFRAQESFDKNIEQFYEIPGFRQFHFVFPQEYSSFADDGCGAYLVYHRDTGELLVYAPYSSFGGYFDFVTVVPGYANLLYRFNDAPDFQSWVELAAQNWFEMIVNG